MSKIQSKLGNIIEHTVPKWFIITTQNALQYAGIKMPAGQWMLFSALNSFFLAVIITLLVKTQVSQAPLLFFELLVPLFTVILYAIFHNILLYYGKKRALQIEEMLPEALQLIAANIRADLPIHKALLSAARPEFGLLADEIAQLGNDILAGKPLDTAFTDFSKRVHSPTITRIAKLMEEGLRTGHDIAGMMEQVAYDMRAFRILEEEAKANIGSYVLFIFLAVLLVAPLLYAISISFVEMSDQIKSTLNINDIAKHAAIGRQSMLVNLMTGDRGISAETLVRFSALNLAASAGIAAILVSVLQTGEALQKLPYVPGFIIISEILFFVILTVLRTVLSGFLTV